MYMSSFTEVHDGDKWNTAFKTWYSHATMNPDRGQPTVMGKVEKATLRFVLHVFSNANAKWKPVHSNQREPT